MAYDLFDFLDAANRGDHKFVDKMSEDEVKKISPYVLLMWANGATRNTAEHVLYTNMFMNPYVFSLAKSPRMLLSLFIAANEDDENPKYKFKKYGMSKESADIELIANHYKCGTAAAKEYQCILSDDDMNNIREIHGIEPKKKGKKK